MGAPLPKTRDFRRNERGFTLQELMTVVAILGILIAIAVIAFLGLLERWRVEAAADQFAADLRLAHGRATNQLTDWRVVFMPDGSPVRGCSSADYCMIKLSAPYEGGGSTPTMDSETPPGPRELPEGTKIKRSPSTQTARAATGGRSYPQAVAAARGPWSSAPTGRSGPCARGRAVRSGSAPTTAAPGAT
jgi:prepilin-type N-terminal cleavage/methylation domain-containing protein